MNKKNIIIVILIVVSIILGVIYFTSNSKNSITIRETTMDIHVNETKQINYKSNDNNISWGSSNNNICTIQSGNVTGISSGVCTVYAIDSNNNVKEVKVNVTDIELKKISFVSSEVSIEEGESLELEYNANPINYTNKLNWNSSNPEICSVNENKITGLKEGTTKITMSYGNLSSSINVTVTKSTLKSIEFKEKQTEVYIGQTKKIEYSLIPDNLENINLTWTSSNNDLIEVDNGILKAKSSGTATIFVKSNNDIESSIIVNILNDNIIFFSNTNEKINNKENNIIISSKISNIKKLIVEVYKDGNIDSNLSKEVSETAISLSFTDIGEYEVKAHIIDNDDLESSIITRKYTYEGESAYSYSNLTYTNMLTSSYTTWLKQFKNNSLGLKQALLKDYISEDNMNARLNSKCSGLTKRQKAICYELTLIETGMNYGITTKYQLSTPVFGSISKPYRLHEVMTLGVDCASIQSSALNFSVGFNNSTLKNLKTKGSKTELKNLRAGDLLFFNTHATMILYNSGSYVVVSDAANTDNGYAAGLRIQQISYSWLKGTGYEARNMDSMYK